jgi:hypothetical protein
MPEDQKEIELKPGETKEIKIDIPLAVQGDDKPEVKPKEDSEVRNQQPENQEEDQNLKNDEENNQEERPGLSDVGQMNQRSERRHYPQTEKMDNLDKPKQNDKKRDSKENGDERSLRDRWRDAQAKKQNKDRENVRKNAKDKSNSNLGDKMTELAGKAGDKLLPKSRIPERGKGMPRDKSDVIDSDYGGPSKKEDLMSSWNKLRNSVRNKKDQNDIKEKRSGTGQIINKGSRLASYEFYRLCWLNLIDSFGLTYLGLLFLFVAKYVAGSSKVIKFVSIKDTSARLDVIHNKEKTDILSMITFVALTMAIVALIILAIFLIILILVALGVIKIEGLSRLEAIIEIIKKIF